MSEVDKKMEKKIKNELDVIRVKIGCLRWSN